MTLVITKSEQFSNVSFCVNIGGGLLFILRVEELLRCRCRFNSSGVNSEKSVDERLKSQML